VLALSEGMVCHIFDRALGIKLKAPFSRLTYVEAMARYGTDKPDTRFGLELKDVSGILKGSGFQVFAQVLESGGIVKGLNAKGCGGYSRKELAELTALATRFGAKGLAAFAVEDGELRSAVTKHLSAQQQLALRQALEAQPGDLLLVVADQAALAHEVLCRLRLELGERLGLRDPQAWDFVWITDFPLFAYNPERRAIEPMHHPFSSPKDEDLGLLESDPLRVRGKIYDLVLNGQEIAGGSIRIHHGPVQEKVLGIIQMPPEQARQRFGFLLDAFEYGAPPHGGIAFGFDRLVAMALREASIRDVIAFPKTAAGVDPLTGAPAPVDQAALEELGISVRRPNGEEV